MDIFSAITLLVDNISYLQFLVVAMLIAAIYYAAFKRHVHSIFDPLFYVLFMSGIALDVGALLTIVGLISYGKALFVVITLILFYSSFLFVDRKAKSRDSRLPNIAASSCERPRAFLLSVLFVAQALLLTITYYFFGVPLLLESRLSQFTDSGGYGALGRLSNGMEFSATLLGFIAIGASKSSVRRWGMALIALFAVGALLSGSKGSILTGVFAWYLAKVYEQRSWIIKIRWRIRTLGLLAFICLTPLVVLYIQGREIGLDLSGSFQALGVRFAAEADPYVYFLGNDLIDQISRSDMIAPLRQVLAAFRLVDRETAVNPGIEVVRNLFQIDEPTGGPNTRLPIYLLYFYGVFGAALAIPLGMGLGWVRNAAVSVNRNHPLRFALLAAVYFHMRLLEVDPQLTVSGLFGMLLAAPIFLLGGLRLYSRSTNLTPLRIASARVSVAR